jgi:hypothetical protein
MMNEWMLSAAMILIIGTLGEVAKGLVGAKAGDRGWRGVYYVTYKAHGIPVGMLFAMPLHPAGVKIPESFGSSLEGFMMWGATMGALAMVVYTLSLGLIRSWFKHQAAKLEGGSEP